MMTDVKVLMTHVLLIDIEDGPYLVEKEEFYRTFFPDILRGNEPYARYRPMHGIADVRVTEIYSFLGLMHMHRTLVERHNEYAEWARGLVPELVNEAERAHEFDWSQTSIHSIYYDMTTYDPKKNMQE